MASSQLMHRSAGCFALALALPSGGNRSAARVRCSFPRTYEELQKGVGLEELVRGAESAGARGRSKLLRRSGNEDDVDRRRTGGTRSSPPPSRNGSSMAPADLDCEHFSRCSGCVIDKALDEPRVMRDAVSFFKRHAVDDMALTTVGVWDWRCRAKLAVRGTCDNPLIGLYEEGSHVVVDIPNCRTHHPRINAAVELVKEAIRTLGVEPYNEETHTGQLRYLQMVVTTFNSSLPAAERYAEGKVQVTLVWNAREEKSVEADLLQPMAEFLWQKGGLGRRGSTPILHSVWANFQTTRTNIIFGGKWRHLLGEQQLWERVGGADICFTPASFGQANVQAFEALLRRLQKKVKRDSAVVELYAGVGIIGISLAVTRACRSVKCVEVNKEAKDSFQLSLARVPDSVDCKISWHCADASVSPINWLEGAEVVIVDPPRKGLDAPVIEALRLASLRGQGKQKSPSSSNVNRVEKRPWIVRAKQDSVVKDSASDWQEEVDVIWPDTLIYVSCGWESFKRDCAALIEGDAWHLDDAHAFNFFPGTDSIETLAVFKRGKSTGTKSSKKKAGRRTGPIPFHRKVGKGALPKAKQ
ncbi:hypothetical protein MPTK1_6g03570 [Marchantia polymorpha subsp. ruderalis]|nr:hypothetical protein MARPO_0035s0136 [Marchantia polymorpha]BBN13449.1 hypothetical protein Mp_6g03570 [Marchantia polymorpha subsp. ruderalis]|eukprot:PTQ41369.1 hypothetical protein MARPO_0035s0136 [Marchantia polymorpha]